MSEQNSRYQPKGIEEEKAAALNKILRKKYAQDIANRLKVLQSPNEHDIKRWVWELLQNAKDTIATTDQEQIEVVVEYQDDYVIFRHNGAPFNLDALYSLIYKKSGEDKEDNAESTGQCRIRKHIYK